MTIDLSNKTYIKIGGLCENFFEVRTVDELRTVLKQTSSPFIVIGNGTNLIFDSSGYNGTVIKLSSEFSFIRPISNSQLVHVGAATWIPRLVRQLSVIGLGGIEHCVGIPATLGGLIAMNGGSQRRSISENIYKIFTINKHGVQKEYTPNECLFSYRDSIFKKNTEIITSAIISLDTIPPYENRKNLLRILSDRRKKFPRKIPNCGSVFMSSPELYDSIGPPGYIIESLGLKGFKIGGAEISPLHANFITNKKNASSSDIINIVRHVNNKCFEKYNIKMKAEPIYITKNGALYHLDEYETNEYEK
ncbi:UDP-N-acetylmuramate dehydrogenase [Providencia alcalifaciens]|uniref:UDP-N-acetylmuramate dehydrogenase n=1 Tax=Providencia alcalifaciens TaxID=126385 RepID=UPI0022755ECA|nr:UDP-N-acetylmuramate dehydrogenase [Providencia rettgeri]MCY0803021.1 UDP-N-acetylmuramate dehydrogenase [Providencia rettgeri]